MYMHHENPLSSSAPCVCTSLRKASRAVTRVYEQAMEGTGLTITQFAILRHLARLGTMPLSRLAEALVMDRTSLYRALAPLERQGWVVIAGRGGRMKDATLSTDGRAAMDSAASAWERAQAAMIDRIGSREWAGLSMALQKIVAINQAVQA